MRRDGLRVAMAEAERFLVRAKAALKASDPLRGIAEYDGSLGASKENSAAKRASLD